MQVNLMSAGPNVLNNTQPINTALNDYAYNYNINEAIATSQFSQQNANILGGHH